MKSSNSRKMLFQPTIVMAVMDMMALRWRDSEIEKAIESAYGRAFSERQFQDLLVTARAQMVLTSKKSRESAFAESVAFYENMIRSVEVDPKLKIQAQTRLDALFSLEPARSNSGADPEKIAENLRLMARDIELTTSTKAG